MTFFIVSFDEQIPDGDWEPVQVEYSDVEEAFGHVLSLLDQVEQGEPIRDISLTEQ